MATPNKAGRKRSRKSRVTERASPTVAPGVEQHLRMYYGLTLDAYVAIRQFKKLNDEDRLQSSRTIIEKSVIEAQEDPDARVALSIEESESLLKGYATLDRPHRAEIKTLIQGITSYLNDSTRKRPFNALMLASPGAGKSHFIKQLAGAMYGERVQAVTFNMATMQSPDDIAQPIDELRNLKVNDKFRCCSWTSSIVIRHDTPPCFHFCGMANFTLVIAISNWERR